MTSKAREPEDLTRLFVELALAGDAEGMAALYEEDAVLAFPPGSETVGRAAIKGVFDELLAHFSDFEQEESRPTLHHGDLALTSTKPSDNTGGRTQIVRRQADGSWLRVIDRPEIRE
jgi:ketosteroid isomerase-like protein